MPKFTEKNTKNQDLGEFMVDSSMAEEFIDDETFVYENGIYKITPDLRVIKIGELCKA